MLLIKCESTEIDRSITYQPKQTVINTTQIFRYTALLDVDDDDDDDDEQISYTSVPQFSGIARVVYDQWSATEKVLLRGHSP